MIFDSNNIGLAPQQSVYFDDIYTWSGTQAITGSNNFFNLISLPLVLSAVSDAGTARALNALKFPARQKKTQILLNARLTGTISGTASADQEWAIQTRRTDGTTIVGSNGAAKLSGTAITNRDVVLTTFTHGVLDPFSVDGVLLGLYNNTGQTITLTAVRILVQCTVNPI